MASANFTNLPRHLAKGDIDFDTASFKVMLVSAVPDATALDTWVNSADVTSEITGTGYTAGGIAQAFTLDAIDTTNNRHAIDWTDIVNGWTTATISAVGAIIYKDTGTAATDLLLHFIDFGGTVSSTAGNYSITYSDKFLITA